MFSRSKRCSVLLPSLVLLFFLTVSSVARCQNTAVKQAETAAPQINMPAPMGMQRGTNLELVLTGSNLAAPRALWTSFPAQVNFFGPEAKDTGASQLRLRLSVPADAPLGFHAIRLVTANGISNLRLFCIDDLPQVLENSNNRSKSTAQAIPVPCVVVGKADAEAADYFKIQVQAGQRLSFEVLGRRLGSLLDPQITLLDPKTGRELPGGHNNDAPGLQTDPRLTYVFKQAGEYLVEIRDTLWRGAPDYWYRLRIGDFPCATTPFPMALCRGTQRLVQFAGSQTEGAQAVEVCAPTDETVSLLNLTPRNPHGASGWPTPLALSNYPELTEQEPNNLPSQANRLPVPCGVTGRFHASGDVDHYVFTAVKGQKYVIEAQTVEWNSPTEVYLILKDLKGNQLAASNPANAPRIDYASTLDGEVVLVVEHLLYWGGPAETYHLTLAQSEPGFDLSLNQDRVQVTPGSVTAVPLQLTRREYSGPVDVRVVGNPYLTGSVTLKAGPPPPPNQPAGILYLHASSDLPPGGYMVGIEGSAIINSKMNLQVASVRGPVSQALANLPYPPRQLCSQVAVGVTEKPPFALNVRPELAAGVRGLACPVTIRADRVSGFSEAIAISPLVLPAGATLNVKEIPAGKSQVQGFITLPATLGLGQHLVGFTGKASSKGRESVVSTTPIALEVRLPFDLEVEPTIIKIGAGGKVKVVVQAVRHGGYQGPINIESKSLPASVSAAKAVIPAGQSKVEIELAAAATATKLEKAESSFVGTATEAGNQQNSSGNVTFTVSPK